MSPETQVSLSLIFSTLAAVGVIFTIYSAIRQTHKSDEDRRIENAEQFAKINVKLDQFYVAINELNSRSNASIESLQRTNLEVTRVNEKINTLFKYHDDHESRLKELEGDTHEDIRHRT